jgi:hypothetical protein
MIYGWDSRPMRAALVMLIASGVFLVLSFLSAWLSTKTGGALNVWLNLFSLATGGISLVSGGMGTFDILTTYMGRE